MRIRITSTRGSVDLSFLSVWRLTLMAAPSLSPRRPCLSPSFPVTRWRLEKSPLSGEFFYSFNIQGSDITCQFTVYKLITLLSLCYMYSHNYLDITVFVFNLLTRPGVLVMFNSNHCNHYIFESNGVKCVMHLFFNSK